MRKHSQSPDPNDHRKDDHRNSQPLSIMSRVGRRHELMRFAGRLRHIPQDAVRAVNDNCKPLLRNNVLTRSFNRAASPIQKHANYVFPLSCISGALCVKFAGHAADDVLLSLGGTVAAASNSFLFGVNLLKQRFSETVSRVSDVVNPATVSMSGLAVAGSMYIASGVHAPDIIEHWGSLDAFIDVIQNTDFSKVGLGAGVGGAALCKLRGAHEWASRLAAAVPVTLGANAALNYTATQEVNVPVVAATTLYAVGAYAMQYLGRQPSPSSHMEHAPNP